MFVTPLAPSVLTHRAMGGDFPGGVLDFAFSETAGRQRCLFVGGKRVKAATPR